MIMSTQNHLKQFNEIIPSIRLQLLPSCDEWSPTDVIGLYAMNSSELMAIAVPLEWKTQIYVYNRFTQVWTCCVDNLPQVKASFYDKSRGKVYLFGLWGVMSYDMRKKYFNNYCAGCDAIMSDDELELYRQNQLQIDVVCKNDEAHILLRSHRTKYIVWNFVTKVPVSTALGEFFPVGRCAVFCTDKPRVFAYSTIYERENDVWKQLEFDTDPRCDNRLRSHRDRSIMVATDCGRYVISFATGQAIIFDMVAKKRKIVKIVDSPCYIDGNGKGVYFYDDGIVLTKAFIHQSWCRENCNNFPSCLVNYIAKHVAQEWIYLFSFFNFFTIKV